MTSMERRRQAERLARTALADVPANYVDKVLMRATGKAIVVWSNLSLDELHNIYATARRCRLVMVH